VTFQYPGKASDAMPFVWLGNQELHQPCHRTSDGYGCDAVALRKLQPDGVVIAWRAVVVPSNVAPAFRIGVTVGRERLPATQTITRPGWCHSVGGDATIETNFFDSFSRTTYLTYACLRGPTVNGTEAQVLAMLASVKVSGLQASTTTSTVTTTSAPPSVASTTTRLTVPNVRGMSTTQALDTLTEAGLYGAWTIPFGLAEIPGSWVVTAQEPPPGRCSPTGHPSC
jgi:hypothetical protein